MAHTGTMCVIYDIHGKKRQAPAERGKEVCNPAKRGRKRKGRNPGTLAKTAPIQRITKREE